MWGEFFTIQKFIKLICITCNNRSTYKSFILYIILKDISYTDLYKS